MSFHWSVGRSLQYDIQQGSVQVVSSCLAGAAVGSLTGSGLADSLGRRKALILSALPMIIGCLLSATAHSLGAMVAGRVGVGIGIGLSSALVPLYISEISPSKVGSRAFLPPKSKQLH